MNTKGDFAGFPQTILDLIKNFFMRNHVNNRHPINSSFQAIIKHIVVREIPEGSFCATKIFYALCTLGFIHFSKIIKENVQDPLPVPLDVHKELSRR